MDPAEVIELLLVVACGFVVGGLAGMLGIGGSFLLVPILHVVLGVPVQIAVGSTACQLLGPSTSALLARRVNRDQLRLPFILTGGIFIGTWLGTSLLADAGQDEDIIWNGQTIPVVELLVLGSYFVLLCSIGTFSLAEVRAWNQGRPLPRGGLARLRLPPVDQFGELEAGSLSIPVLSLFGLVTGLVAGLLGISGGLLLITGLVYLLGIRSRHAILASLVVVWITSLHATVFHAWAGNVDLKLTFAMMIGGTIGAALGAELSGRLKGPALRSSLGWLALAAAGLVAFQLVTLLT